MLTPTIRHRWFATLAGAAVGLAGVLTTGAAPAAAAAGCGFEACPPASGSAEGGTISVTVRGNGVRASGSYSVAETVVSAPAVCWYTRYETGAEFWAKWQPDGAYGSMWNHNPTPLQRMVVSDAELDAHKDDVEGRWAFPSCDHANYTGEQSQWGTFWDDYMATHGPVFVPAGQDVPAPEVSIEVLRDIAQRALTLPAPTVDWNPRLEGNAATVVNFDTWVWLEDPTTAYSVTASAGANAATVAATLRDMTLSAPYADGTTCAGTGIPWRPGATSDCSIVFTRSSANQPDLKTPLTITTGWDTTWSANDVPQGALEDQVMTSQVGVPVAEVQTIITKN